MFVRILKTKLLIFLFIGLPSLADEKELYIVEENGQTEIHIRETPEKPPQVVEEKLPVESEEDSYSFCDSPMQEPIKLVVMEQLYKSCADVSLDDLKRIRGLSVNHSQLGHLGPDDFVGLDNLTHVDFSHNSLRYIHPDSFKSLTQLDHLNISHNMLRELSANLLSSLKDLSYLNLSKNLLTELHAEFLMYNSRLKYLDLSNNLLKNIDEDLLFYLIQLSYLDLSHNQLQEIPSGMLVSLPSLIELNISHNQLERVVLGSLNSLIRLNLSYNQLSEIKGLHIDSLIELNISYNELRNIPWNVLDQLTHLTTFNYTGNSLSVVEINPKRDLYSTGVDEEEYDCWLGICKNAYAYIEVNKERYKFMRCRGTKPNSKCVQQAEQWKKDLDRGYTLILQMDGQFIISVNKRGF
ncbi:MAG: leucine-rich repeat domain-containing protein [Bdellovibrionales bacterium]|nr:leucine-rich repeat domain-containing protein [Bdellovibrionales bacterium]